VAPQFDVSEWWDGRQTLNAAFSRIIIILSIRIRVPRIFSLGAKPKGRKSRPKAESGGGVIGEEQKAPFAQAREPGGAL